MGLTDLENQLKFETRDPISTSSIDNITLELVNRLFWNKKYIFTLEKIVRLLNAVSKSKFAPKETQGLPWGECIMSCISEKAAANKISHRNDVLSRQQTETMITSKVVLNGVNKISRENRTLMKSIVGYSNKKNANNLINKCTTQRVEFDNNSSNTNLCLPHPKLCRERWPFVVISSFLKKWAECTSPSPSKNDKILLRDISGQLVRDKQGGRIKKIKRTHSQHDINIFKEYLCEYKQLLDEQIFLENMTHYPCIRTFVRYKPNYVEKKTVICHMTCDHCLEIKYLVEALKRVLQKCHTCAADDLDCYINVLNDLDLESKSCLLKLCCKKEHPIFPTVDCAHGNCDECDVKKCEQLLFEFKGCKTLKQDLLATQQVNYQKIVKLDQGDKKGVYVAHFTASFDEYKQMFVDELQEHVKHLFEWKKQQYETLQLTTAKENKCILPHDILMITMDFLSNYHIPASFMPVCMGTKRYQIQLGVIVQYRSIPQNSDMSKSEIQTEEHFYLSDNTHHGWVSGIPITKSFLSQQINKISQQEGIRIRGVVINSDRGPKDFWTVMFFAFLYLMIGTLAIAYILFSTSAVCHGKFDHDRAGGRVVVYLDDSFYNNTIKLKPGVSIALQITQFLTRTFSTTKDGKTKRFFHYIPSEDIRHAKSALNRIITAENKGIKSYHCCLIDQKGIKFRHHLCSHITCFETDFDTDCNEADYCGTWQVAKPGNWSNMPKYEELPLIKPKKKQKIQTDNENQALSCIHCKKGYKSSGWLKKHEENCNEHEYCKCIERKEDINEINEDQIQTPSISNNISQYYIPNMPSVLVGNNESLNENTNVSFTINVEPFSQNYVNNGGLFLPGL
eukprot:463650_1